jgi:hypothetical protein
VVADGADLAAQRLGQRAQQGRHQVLAQPPHLPVEPRRVDRRHHGQGDVDGHAVEVGGRVELVAEPQAQVALVPHVGEGVDADVAGARVDHVLEGEREQVGSPPPLVLPPPVEVAGGGHRRGDPGVVEVEQRVLADEDVPPPHPVLEGPDLLHELAVGVDERVVRRPRALDEGVLQEQVPGAGRVDGGVGTLRAATTGRP